MAHWAKKLCSPRRKLRHQYDFRSVCLPTTIFVKNFLNLTDYGKVFVYIVSKKRNNDRDVMHDVCVTSFFF